MAHMVKRRKLSDGQREIPGYHSSIAVSRDSSSDHAKSVRLDPALSPIMDQYNGDIFQMQTAELLREALPNFEVRLKRVDKLLRRVKETIDSLPSRGQLNPIEAKAQLWAEYQVAVPFPLPLPPVDSKWTVSYAKPIDIDIIGSVAQKTATKGHRPLSIDMALTMPPDILQAKDFLDYRYFHKRAYYLASIAAGLKVCKDLSIDLQYEWQNGNVLQPVLHLSALSGDEGNSPLRNAYIRILLGPPKELFMPSKLLPWKSCVMPHASEGRQSRRNESQPTPFYNSTLQSECLHSSYSALFRSVESRCPGFKSASILMNIWGRQRGFAAELQNGGFGAFESTAMIALFLQGDRSDGSLSFPSGYSAYQLFRGLLSFIAAKDMIRSPVYTKTHTDTDMKALKSVDPVFFDNVRSHNVLFKMSAFSFRRLQHEARITLQALDSNNESKFDSCFIVKAYDPTLTFDYLLHLQAPSSPGIDTEAEASVCGMPFAKKICSTLSRALDDRLRLLYPQEHVPVAWPINSQELPTNSPRVIIGMLVNPEHVDRTIDRGPAATETKAAASFRRFWGEKAELRRFKDGSILESVLWSQNKKDGHILIQIVTYIISRHFGADLARFLEFQSDHSTTKKDIVRDVWQSQSHAIDNPLNGILNNIRTLGSLPLSIRQVSAASPELCGTSIATSNQIYLPRKPTIDIVVQFESSTRWPDNLYAIQRTKVAFLLKIAELLQSADMLTSARLGLENTSTPLLNSAYLDVSLRSLKARLRIYHDRELVLLRERLADKQNSSRTQIATSRAISIHERTFLKLPRHSQDLRSFCNRYSLLAPTIRLLKLWCSSHLLIPHFTPEFLDMLVLRVFTDPFPYSTPGSLRTAFLRVLTFIARWDWRREPLILVTKGELSTAQSEAIYARFKLWRNVDPAMNRVAIFAASDWDPDGLTWTDGKPTVVAATRFTSLARAAVDKVRNQRAQLEMDTLFSTALQDYDFLIYLNTDTLKQDDTSKTKFKNLRQEDSEHEDSTLFDPIDLFIEEILRCVGNHVTLFHNGLDKSIVGGLWNPQLQPRPWKTSLGNSTEPAVGGAASHNSVNPNKQAMLNDITRLGGNMIKRIKEKQLDSTASW